MMMNDPLLSRYMGEGAEMAHRIDSLLEECRNSETVLQQAKKEVPICSCSFTCSCSCSYTSS